MAQGFYNAQEAAAKLQFSEDELRKLVRDGQLREFRDVRGAMYKAAEVDALVAERGGPAKEDSMAALISAEGAPPEATPIPATPATPAGPPTGAAAKEGSTMFSLEPVSDKEAGKTDVFSLESAGEEGKKSGSGSGSSISLLDDLESVTIPADPMAETVVATPGELDSPAGGSGLLDLARESDDTSLGAELYDDTGGEEAKAAAPAAAAAGEPVAVAHPEYYMAPAAEVTDPMAPGYIGLAVVGMVMLLVVGMAVAAAVMNSWPSLLGALYSHLLLYLLGAVLVAGLAWLIGWMVGRQAEARQAVRSGAVAESEA